MAARTSVIKSSGGDYISLQDWHDSIAADRAVGDTETASIEESGFDAGTVIINVSNANTADTKIIVPTAYRMQEQSEWATSTRAAEGKGAHIDATSGGVNGIDKTSGGDLYVEGLEVWGNDTLASGITNQSGSLFVDKCVIHEFVYCIRLNSATPASSIISNCFLYKGNTATADEALVLGAGTGIVTVYNCTGYDNGGLYGLYRTAGTMYVYNSAIFGATLACIDGATGGAFNIVSDTSADGTTNYNRSITDSDFLKNATYATLDLHIKDENTWNLYFADYYGDVSNDWNDIEEDAYPAQSDVNAADFELGDTEHVNCGQDASLQFTTGGFAVSCWMKVEAWSTSQVMQVICRWNPANNENEWRLSLRDISGTKYVDNRADYGTGAGPKVWDRCEIPNYSNGSWFHIHTNFDIDGKQQNTWVNGVAQAMTRTDDTTSETVMNSGENNPTTIGAYSQNLENFDGNLRNIRIYSAELSEADIISEMRVHIASTHTDILEEWLGQSDWTAEQNASNDGTPTSGIIPFNSPTSLNTSIGADMWMADIPITGLPNRHHMSNLLIS